MAKPQFETVLQTVGEAESGSHTHSKIDKLSCQSQSVGIFTLCMNTRPHRVESFFLPFTLGVNPPPKSPYIFTNRKKPAFRRL